VLKTGFREFSFGQLGGCPDREQRIVHLWRGCKHGKHENGDYRVGWSPANITDERKTTACADNSKQTKMKFVTLSTIFILTMLSCCFCQPFTQSEYEQRTKDAKIFTVDVSPVVDSILLPYIDRLYATGRLKNTTVIFSHNRIADSLVNGGIHLNRLISIRIMELDTIIPLWDKNNELNSRLRFWAESTPFYFEVKKRYPHFRDYYIPLVPGELYSYSHIPNVGTGEYYYQGANDIPLVQVVYDMYHDRIVGCDFWRDGKKENCLE
jgi:hypothetical protein